MSKLSDYSKFDHLDEEDSDDEKQQQQPPPPPPRAATTTTTSVSAAPAIQTTQQTTKATPQEQAGPNMRKNETNGRYVFEYNGNPIYEWDQKLDHVTLYVKPPPTVTKGNQILCHITPHQIKLGLQGASQFFINEQTFGTVDVSESTWSLEDDDDDDDNNNGKLIVVYLTKAHRGELWDTALKGNNATPTIDDPLAKEQFRKDMMLERFQEENPGFDFQDAEFNGSVPDARTFMGGVKYQ